MINAQKTQEETEIPPNYLKDLDRGPITEMSAEDMGWGGSGGDAYRDPSPLCDHCLCEAWQIFICQTFASLPAGESSSSY